jgi:hypothetical protein
MSASSKKKVIEPHQIAVWAENTQVFELQLLKGKVHLSSFSPAASWEEVVAFARTQGEGDYMVVATDMSGERYEGARPLRVSAIDAIVPQKTENDGAVGTALDVMQTQMDADRRERGDLRREMKTFQTSVVENKAATQSEAVSSIQSFYERQEERRLKEEDRRFTEDKERKEREAKRQSDHEASLADMRAQETSHLQQQTLSREQNWRAEAVEREDRIRKSYEQQLSFQKTQHEQQLSFERYQSEQRIKALQDEMEARLKMQAEHADERLRLQERDHRLKLQQHEVKMDKEFGFGQGNLPKAVKEEFFMRKLDQLFPEKGPFDRLIEQAQPFFEQFQAMQQPAPPMGTPAPGQLAATPEAPAPTDAGFDDSVPDVIEMDAV